MGQFRDVLLLLSRLKAQKVIDDYAIAGAVAVDLWTEPTAAAGKEPHSDRTAASRS